MAGQEKERNDRLSSSPLLPRRITLTCRLGRRERGRHMFLFFIFMAGLVKTIIKIRSASLMKMDKEKKHMPTRSHLLSLS